MIARLSLLTAIATSIACSGGNSSPTSPTTATRVIALEGNLTFGDVLVGHSKELVVTIRNNGTGAMTMTGISGSSGVTPQTAASPLSGSIPSGGSLNVTFRFSPTSPGTISGTITFTTDHTSGTNTMTMSGTGVVVPVTVVGVITSPTTRAPLRGVRVSALTPSLTTTIASTSSDGNGYYSLVVPSGVALTMNYTLSGYNIRNIPETFTADTRRDISLTPSASAARALEYRVSGTGLELRASRTHENCSGGTSQQGEAQLPWSFTCGTFGTGDFIDISAQTLRNGECVQAQILAGAVLYRESESCGAFVIAAASGSY